jgi:hypothetical protein
VTSVCDVMTAALYRIRLTRTTINQPWGFRLNGGSLEHPHLTMLKVITEPLLSHLTMLKVITEPLLL